MYICIYIYIYTRAVERGGGVYTECHTSVMNAIVEKGGCVAKARKGSGL